MPLHARCPPQLDGYGAVHDQNAAASAASARFFKSPHRPLRRFAEVVLPAPTYEHIDSRRHPVRLVCYGGTFATTRASVRRHPRASWERLTVALARGDNIEEGHYTERLWAALLSTPPSKEVASAVLAGAAGSYMHMRKRATTPGLYYTPSTSLAFPGLITNCDATVPAPCVASDTISEATSAPVGAASDHLPGASASAARDPLLPPPHSATRLESEAAERVAAGALAVGAPRGPRAIVHVGAHKTGSTHLQSFLMEHAPDLMAQGWQHPTGPFEYKNMTNLALALRAACSGQQTFSDYLGKETLDTHQTLDAFASQMALIARSTIAPNAILSSETFDALDLCVLTPRILTPTPRSPRAPAST